MIDQISQLENHESLTPAQIETAFAESVLKPESFYTFNSLVIAIGGDVSMAEILVGAMRAAGLNSSADSLISRGIDFGLPQVQGLIDSLEAADDADQFTPEIAASLKGLGQQTRWASLGGTGDPPDATAIATERARHAASLVLAAIKTRSDAAYEAAAMEYRAGNFDTIVSAAEASWSGS